MLIFAIIQDIHSNFIQILQLYNLFVMIIEDPAFQQSLQTLQRSINCIVDEDRNTRKSGLTTIKIELFKKATPLVIKLVEKTNLAKNLCKALEDKIEANREIALGMLRTYLERVKGVPEVDKDVIEVFARTLISRVNSTPFAETSQDLRLDVIKLIGLLVAYPQILIANISELCSALSKCLADPFPELKKETCLLLNILSKELRYNIGHHSQAIVKALAVNLAHQHAKVRKSTVQTLGNLLITESCSQNFVNVQAAIKACTFDKINQVRKSTYECISRVLNGFSIKALKSYEQILVGYLLNGLSDETPEISTYTLTLLNEVGLKRQQLQKEISPSAMQVETPI